MWVKTLNDVQLGKSGVKIKTCDKLLKMNLSEMPVMSAFLETRLYWDISKGVVFIQGQMKLRHIGERL